METRNDTVCKKCGAHATGDIAYCPHCGELLSADNISIVNKKDYDSLKDEKLRVEWQLSSLKQDGYAPYRKRIIKDEEYNELSKKAERLESIVFLGKVAVSVLLILLGIFVIQGVCSYLFYDEIQKEEGKYGVRKPFDFWVFPTIPFEYDRIIKDSMYNVYYVYLGEKVGVFDDDGNMTIPCEMDSIRSVGNDMSIMYRNGMQGVCHRDGHIIIQCENQSVFWKERPTEWTWEIPNNYVGNIIPVKRSDNSGWDIISKSGIRVNSKNYEEAVQTGIPDLIKVKNNGTYNLIDVKGRQMLTNNVQRISRFQEGFAFVEYSSKEDIIDERGKVHASFNTNNYSTHWHFYEGLFAMQNVNGKIGYYDTKGQLVIPQKFEQARIGNELVSPCFHGDSARISYNGQNGYVFKDGSIKLDAQ